MIFSLKKIREASLLTPQSSVKSSRPSSIHSAIAILIMIAFSMHMNASRTRMTVVNSMLLFHRSMTSEYGNSSMKCVTGLSTTSLKPPPTQITQTESNRPWAIKYNHPGPVAILLPAHNINITIRNPRTPRCDGSTQYIVRPEIRNRESDCLTAQSDSNLTLFNKTFIQEDTLSCCLTRCS